MSSRQGRSIKVHSICNNIKSVAPNKIASKQVINDLDTVLSIRQAKSIAELWLNYLSGRENLDSYLLAGIISFLSAAEKSALFEESQK